jgi:hypothetical protein
VFCNWFLVDGQHLYEKEMNNNKNGGGGAWRVARGAWRVARGAWRVARGAWRVAVAVVVVYWFYCYYYLFTELCGVLEVHRYKPATIAKAYLFCSDYTSAF